MNAVATATSEKVVSILALIPGNENGTLPEKMVRYILDLEVSERDKSRMHDMAVRNQDDALTPAEREEMFAFGKATTMLSILKSKARRTLGVTLQPRSVS